MWQHESRCQKCQVKNKMKNFNKNEKKQKNKMASEEIDPQPHKYWLSVESWQQHYILLHGQPSVVLYVV